MFENKASVSLEYNCFPSIVVLDIVRILIYIRGMSSNLPGKIFLDLIKKIEIRQIKEQDKEAFIALSLALTKFNKRQHDKHYPNFQEILDVRKKRVEEAFAKISKYSSKVIIMAFEDNIAVGYLRSYIHDHKLRVGCLDELFIKNEARGQGIGKKLLDAGTQWMKEKNIVRMITSVYFWNTSARTFYEQEGFKEYSVFCEKAIGPANK